MTSSKMDFIAAITLVALFCSFQCFAENLTPFNSTYDLACSTAPNVVGSYRPAQTNSSNVQQIGNLVYNNWLRNASSDSCTAADATQSQSNVTAACSQIVAGTNWAIIVAGSSKCSLNSTEGAAIQSNVSLAAKVYSPLGNAAPQITMLKLVNLIEEEI